MQVLRGLLVSPYVVESWLQVCHLDELTPRTGTLEQGQKSFFGPISTE